MTLRSKANLAGACLLTLALTGAAHLAHGACDAPQVIVEAELDEAWQRPLQDLAARVHQAKDVDPCTKVRVIGAPSTLFVQVELADGRSAVRRVENQALLVATVESLIMPLPGGGQREPVPEAPVPAAPAPAPALVAREGQGAAGDVKPSTQAHTAAPYLSIDFGLGPSVRLADAPRFLGYGVTGYAQLVLHSWLIGMWGRWDIKDRPVGSRQYNSDFDDMTSTLFGAYVGGRVGLGPLFLEGQLGPNAAVSHRAARIGTAGDAGGAFGDLSVGCGLKLRTRHNTWPRPNFFALLAGEMYPRRLGRGQQNPELLPLPAWSGTLALGATWSAL